MAWQRSMEAYLIVKDVWDVIEDGLQAPISSEVRARDRKAKAYITLSVSDEIKLFIGRELTAKETWEALEARFNQSNEAISLELRRQLHAIQLGEQETITSYLARAQGLRNRIASASDHIDDKLYVGYIMQGLQHERSPYREAIINVSFAIDGKLPTIANLTAMLMRIEGQQVARQEQDAGHAYSISHLNRSRGGRRGGRGGSSAGRNAGRTPPPTSNSRACWLCGKTDHLKVDCPDRKKALQPSQTANNVSTMLENYAFMVSSPGNGSHDFALDSCASSHFCGDSGMFQDMRPCNDTVELAVQGMKGRVEGVGDIILPYMTLKNVLYVPGITHLISVPRLQLEGWEVIFHGDSRHVTLAKEGTRLKFLMDAASLKYHHAHSASSLLVEREGALLWHQRMAHASWETLIRTATAVRGMPIGAKAFASCKDLICIPCMKGSFTAASHPLTSRVYQVGEVIHSDLMGPVTPASLGGAQFVVTAKDDGTGSGYLEVGFLKRKSEAEEWLRDFIIRFERQGGLKVKHLRTDRGGEYLHPVGGLCKKLGLVHETTPAGISQANGTAEAVNKVLMRKARTLLVETGLPSFLWAEAVAYIAYTENLLVHRGKVSTPLELAFKRQPSVSHVRAWGSKVIIHADQGKLLPRGVEGFFVGYAVTSGVRAVRVYASVRGNNRVVISDSAKFLDEGLQLMHHDELLSCEIEEDTAHVIDVSEEVPTEVVDVSESADVSDQTPVVDLPARQSYVPNAQTSGEPIRRSARILEHGGRTALQKLSVTHDISSGRPRGANAGQKRVHFSNMVEISKGATDPTSLKEAMSSDFKQQWLQAMSEEYQALLENGTWILVKRDDLPGDCKPIGCKWVFKVKRDSLGNVERYKARLVAKGFQQTYGVDFEETYAPTAKAAAVRTIASLAAAKGLELEQVDFITAFLQGSLKEKVYMEQPEYFGLGKEYVCCLQKSIYGLHQAGNVWAEKLSAALLSIGFVVSHGDNALFHKQDASVHCCAHVDDMLLCGPREGIEEVKSALGGQLKMKVLGKAEFYLGMEILRDITAGTITISQVGKTGEILSTFEKYVGNGRDLPVPHDVQQRLYAKDQELFLEPQLYRAVVGSLMYLMVGTRPDLAYALGILGQWQHEPTMAAWEAARGVLGYLSRYPRLGLRFGGNIQLKGYCDSDWGGDIGTRRSRSGVVFTLGHGPLVYRSKLQKVVSLSVTEGELQAASEAVRDALHLRKVMSGFRVDTQPIAIHCDNSQVLDLMKHDRLDGRSKHVDIQFAVVRERHLLGHIAMTKIATEYNVADFLTKVVSVEKFRWCLDAIGMVEV